MQNGIRYELKHWELQEKEGEEITRTLEKRVEYPKVEAAEEVPEIILADETDPGWILLSGNLYRKNVEITGKQWKEEFFQYLLHFIPMGQMNMNWEIL